MVGISNKLLKNTTLVVAAEAFSKALFFLFIILAAKLLGKPEYGLLAFVLAANKIVFTLCDFGLHHLATREIAGQPGRAGEYLSGTVTVKITVTIILATGVALYSFSLKSGSEMKTAFLFCTIAVMGDSFADYFENVCIAAGRIWDAVISKFLYGGFLLAGCAYLGIALSGRPVSPVEVVEIYMAAGILHMIFPMVAAGTKIGFSGFKKGLAGWKWILKESSYIGLVIVFISIYTRVDQLMLKYINGERAVAYFDVAFRVKDGFTLILAAVMRIIFPEMARIYRESPDKIRKFTQNLLIMLAVGFMPILAVIFIYGDGLMALLFKPEYVQATGALKILTVAAFVIFLSNPLYFLIIAVGRQKANTIFMGAALLMKILLNIIVLHSYSYMGAAATTLAIEVFIFMLLLYYSSKYVVRADNAG